MRRKSTAPKAPKVPSFDKELLEKITLRKTVWEAKNLFSDFRILMPPAKILKAWIMPLPANLRTRYGKQCLAAWIEKEPGKKIRALFLIEEHPKPVFSINEALKLFPDFFTPDELRQLADVPACVLDTWEPEGEDE